MYKVYWANYKGRGEDPEATFDSFEKACDYIEEQDEDCCDEYYVIYDTESKQWLEY